MTDARHSAPAATVEIVTLTNESQNQGLISNLPSTTSFGFDELSRWLPSVPAEDEVDSETLEVTGRGLEYA